MDPNLHQSELDDNVSREKAELFIISPTFSNVDVAPFLFIDPKDEFVWKGGKLMSDNPDRTEIYSLAKRRYVSLTKYVEFFPKEPQLLLILAETHLWLSDYAGCLKYLRSLQDLVGSCHCRLANIILLIQKYDEIEAKDDDDYHYGELQTEGAEMHDFQHPDKLFENLCIDSDEKDAYSRWYALQSRCNEVVAMQHFCRLACIATNILEGIFEFDGQIWPRLIREGFLVNSIEGISPASRIKNPTTIIRILENTMHSLSHINACVKDPNLFTVDFIKRIHSLLLNDDNFEDFEEDEDGMAMCALIPKGEYRTRGCRAYHHDNKEITQYCNPKLIASEMDEYVQTVRELLVAKDIDVFVKCAWIQWGFLRIHPFSDGNGRVSRIISSIPLSMLQLPPIVITSKYKLQYFTALQAADRENNLKPLVLFLRKSLFRAIKEIEDLPDDESLNQNNIDDGKTVHRIKKLSLKRDTSDSSTASSHTTTSSYN